MSRGCLIALIIVGIIAVIVVAVGIVCYIYQDQIVEIGLNKLSETVASQIKENLPEGYTAEDVDKVIEDFKQAYKDKKIDQEEIQRISAMFQNMLEDKKIDQDEAEEFLEELKKVIE